MHEDFRNKINKAICVGFIDGDFWFLNFLCYFGTFIEDKLRNVYYAINKILV